MEVLVAALIIGMALAAMARLWSFSYNVTLRTDDSGVAYNLARQAIERIKLSGFVFAPEGTTTRYYGPDGLGESSTAQSNSRYTVSIVVTTDRWMTNASTGITTPAPTAKRDVAVTVRLRGTNEVIHTEGCSLVRSGV
jgi:hypothetical protein